MKKKIKQIITTVLAGTMALSLVAYGNATGNADAATNSQTESTQAEETDTESNDDTSAEAEDNTEAKENSANGELTKITVGVDAGILAYLPVVAQEKGFFAEQGIDAEFVNFAYGIDTLNAVVLGEVQIGAAYDYAAATRLAQKSNLRLGASAITNQDDAWWFETTVPDATSIADVKGKKVGYMDGTVWEYLWAKEFESAGLSKDDFEMIPFSANSEIITAYASGNVDVAAGQNEVLAQLEAIDGRTVLNTTGDIGATSQAYILADETFIKENSDVFAGYLTALQEAIDYIQTDKEDAAKIIAEYLTLEPKDVESAIDTFKLDIKLTQEDYDHLQNIVDWASDNGVIEPISVADYLDEEPIKQAFPDKVTYQR